MIESIHISNFKCINSSEIKLNNLTLLTGKNSSGKSTIIQAILLVAHNISNNFKSSFFSPAAPIGTFQEAKNFILNEKTISFKIYSNNEHMVMNIQHDGDSGSHIPDSFRKLFDNSNEKIQYVPAARVGALDLYPKFFATEISPKTKADFAAHYFEAIKKTILPDDKIIDTNSYTLDTQCNYWLKKILDCEMETQDVVDSDYIKIMYSHNRKRPIRPRNIGSGVSYLISILVICLSARKDDIILIENPEIHLHPSAQSSLTDFFTFISNTGVQLVIETHSDHVFNGIRKNIHKNEIKTQDVSVVFFDLDKGTGHSNPVQIEIEKNGKIANHQKGLFDQFNSDLNELLGI